MNNQKSTFERMMEDPQWKSDFDKGYEEFLLSEFISARVADEEETRTYFDWKYGSV